MSIISLVGGSSTFTGATGGKVYPNRVTSTVAAAVIPANASRRRLTFHNPGTIDLYVFPVKLMDFNGNLATSYKPSPTSLEGSFLVVANGGTLIVEGECQFEWWAFLATDGQGAITIMDSNV